MHGRNVDAKFVRNITSSLSSLLIIITHHTETAFLMQVSSLWCASPVLSDYNIDPVNLGSRMLIDEAHPAVSELEMPGFVTRHAHYTSAHAGIVVNGTNASQVFSSS